MENQAIIATGVTKCFGEGEARVTAVNGVGLVAYFGEMLFIVGPSGSGTTTNAQRDLRYPSSHRRQSGGHGADIWSLSIVTQTTSYPLNQSNQALAHLRAGRFEGAAVAAVLVP